MELIKFPSIRQFRNTVYDVNRTFNFIGMDENNEPMYDESKSKPTLTFKGTVKLHGTNAGVCYNDADGFWCQSHKKIITPLKDNAGFAFFVESKKEAFIKIFEEIKEKNKIDTSVYTISLYGEWAGKGIQKSVGINNIEKTFFIIGVKVAHPDPEIANQWIDCTGYRDKENRIYNIHDFKTYSIDIDFNHPELSQNEIIKQTLEVEEQCPVSKEFGFFKINMNKKPFSIIDGNISCNEKLPIPIKNKILELIEEEKLNYNEGDYYLTILE